MQRLGMGTERSKEKQYWISRLPLLTRATHTQVIKVTNDNPHHLRVLQPTGSAHPIILEIRILKETTMKGYPPPITLSIFLSLLHTPSISVRTFLTYLSIYRLLYSNIHTCTQTHT